ncbi:hypothetical protein [Undibacterium umbellatum]|uniref:Uncharacterized protein n=1 Tax=Undibacterium umbellatum TaxID=2762300 RepID=A0ABR6Z3S8_9BURK|nr:hypothetical protein [Undibacterium umbellatum]MBC3906206.1 hypothetical protein [Undibacterium umbellatum]
MNGQTLNAAALNSVVPIAQTVFIPASSTGIAFTVFERASVSMAGATGVSMDAVGDVAKVALLAASVTGIDFMPAGELAVMRRVAIDNVLAGIAFSLTGLLNADAYMPNASVSMAMGATGTLTNYAQMQGNTGIALEGAAPAPGAIKYLQGESTILLSSSGELSSLKPIAPSSTGVAFSLSGQVGNPIRLSGVVSIAFYLDGTLSINPNARDADDKVAVRPFQNRTVSR